MQKIIGTAVPLSALYSLKYPNHTHGTFDEAVIFLDWLKKSSQNAWVMLPISETQLEQGSSSVHVPSPYKGYGIGIDPKYLGSQNYIYDMETFTKENAYWLDTYGLFCSLRDYFQTDDWREWDRDIRDYDEDAIKVWNTRLEEQIYMYKKDQCALHAVFFTLKEKAQKNGITLVGDIPFYISLKSPLVWANQDLFQFEKGGKLSKVSGSIAGIGAHFARKIERQVWGHPLYDWEKNGNKDKIMDLLKMRLRYHRSLFDMVRFDYAKGLFNYTAIDLADERQDSVIEGPGESIVEQLASYTRKIGLPLYLEDTGNYVYHLHQAMQKYDLPGIKIFRFAYSIKHDRMYEPYADIFSYPQNTVAYTTTHDSETLVGYLKLLSEKAKHILAKHIHVGYSGDDRRFAQAIIKAIIASPAHIAVIPIQDWLLSQERINIPGTEQEVNDPNWRYRLKIPIEKLPTDLF